NPLWRCTSLWNAAAPRLLERRGGSPSGGAGSKGDSMNHVTTGPQLRGVNRAGAEYGDDWDGWTGQTFYEWPSVPVRTNELNAYAAKGMNVVRLPISWERVQHMLNGPLDLTYQAHLVDYVQAATAMGFAVIIDLHNYGRYAAGAYNAAGAQVPTYTQHVL